MPSLEAFPSARGESNSLAWRLFLEKRVPSLDQVGRDFWMGLLSTNVGF